MTYKQAFDRITEAYIKGELNPQKCSACFVGNLLGGNPSWEFCTTDKSIYAHCRGVRSPFADRYKRVFQSGIELLNKYGYTREDITMLENNFLSFSPNNFKYLIEEDYEDHLFLAMESTLEMLKQIHEREGEIVDAPVFTKRQLQTV